MREKLRAKLLMPFVAVVVIVGSLIVSTERASAAWVQQAWNLTKWGSVQSLRDSAAPNHWKFVWYAPGDGVPSYVVSEIWLGAPCNGGVQLFPGTGNGNGSGSPFAYHINQKTGSQYSCLSTQDGFVQGTVSFTETTSTCATWYTEGSIYNWSLNGEAYITSLSYWCNDGTPSYVGVTIPGYPA